MRSDRSDHRRFREIVRGKIKQNLRKYISQGEMIGRKGKDLVTIPLPQIDIPHFRFGNKEQGGVGQGEGDVGEPLGQGEPQRGRAGQGRRQAGRAHARGRAVARGAGRRSSARSWSCRDIEPKGKEQHRHAEGQVHRHPPHRPRVAAPLQAHLQAGAEAADRDRHLRPGEPGHRPDPRGQALPHRGRPTPLPQSNAVIIYMMDVSGSMGDEQKEIVRIEALLDRHLAAHASTRASRRATSSTTPWPSEVDRDTFFHTRESRRHDDHPAPTSCARRSSTTDYPPTSGTSTRSTSPTATTGRSTTRVQCIELLEEQLLPDGEPVLLRPGREPVRLGPVHQGSATSTSTRTTAWSSREIKDKDAIMESIKEFLGQGQVERWRVRMSTAPAVPAPTCSDEIEGYARDYGLDFFETDLRDPRLRRDQRGRGLRRLPDPLPALALRHGVRAAHQGLRVRALEDLRDGHQQQPCYAYLLEGNRWSTRSW